MKSSRRQAYIAREGLGLVHMYEVIADDEFGSTSAVEHNLKALLGGARLRVQSATGPIVLINVLRGEMRRADA